MKFIGDFHIHSKYSRATSREMNLENLNAWAHIKGTRVLGTGDFTHPVWFKELCTKLEPAEPGLFRLKDRCRREGSNSLARGRAETRFILTAEISGIYSKHGKTRRIHNLLFAPSLDVVEKINTHLGWIGNLGADGRPILGLDSEELAKIVLDIDERSMIVPAHCLLPHTLIHAKKNFLKPISDMKVGDLVFTHKNRWRRVSGVFKRPYKGTIYTIKPYYFRGGLTTTPEHPFFAIRTQKNCSWNNGICKPQHNSNDRCKRKFFRTYKPTWIRASELQKGDVLVFPRFRHAFENHTILDLKEALDDQGLPFSVQGGSIIPLGSRHTPIKRMVVIDKDFCRLAGYYLAEGYTNGRDAVGFTFHKEEREYIRDVVFLMGKVFDFDKKPKIRISGDSQELIFYSKALCGTFANLFYYSQDLKNASTKSLPNWMLGLSPDLQAEIFKGWWRGDKGYTSSRILMNQIKIILLRLDIIPSIYVDSVEDHKKRGRHYFAKEKRSIYATHDSYSMNNLSFFEDQFGLLETKEFSIFKPQSRIRHGWIDEDYIYLPIRDIETKAYEGDVYNLEVERDNSYVSEFATIHNCWTPWFSIFGSMSGFDSIEECFGSYAKYIYALETGLSSDPAMNWRLSKLDSISLISNSDSHSLTRIGREANIFDTELSYSGIIDAIRSKDPQKFLATIEFFPEEGKYHYDGHRNCGVRFHPDETKRSGGMCPRCAKPVTIGVLSRVEALADRGEGELPSHTIPYYRLIPLDQIIGDALGIGTETKAVYEEYQNLIRAIGNEFRVLLEAPRTDLERVTREEIVEGIMRVREGKVHIQPGYDGEYGKVSIFQKGEQARFTKQTTLFG